jgi:5'-methylthioadenosine phosphorylase
MRKAIIGGTGVYGLDGGQIESRTVITDYGAVEVDILKSDPTAEIVFLARHGRGHDVPPHLINYRANMMALSLLGVDEIYATCAVGSMREAFGLGEVVLLKDFMDFTKSRIQTFFDGSDRGVVDCRGDVKRGVAHALMSRPYCPGLSQAFRDEAGKTGIDLKGEAVYVCTEGPRFETAAEIAMYSHLGGDVVGMTNVPECVLAKELGMCYSAVGIITNWCTGINPGAIEIHDINKAMAKNKELVTSAFIRVLSDASRKSRAAGHEEQTCRCDRSLISL